MGKKESIETSLESMLSKASAQVHGEPTIKESSPEPIDKDTASTRNIGIRISNDLHRRVRLYAAAHEIKMKDLIVSLLEERLAQDE